MTTYLNKIESLDRKIESQTFIWMWRAFYSTVSAIVLEKLTCLCHCSPVDCFILDEPNEWAYGIDGENKKVIDITDDFTGQLHDLARQHSAIYVNEVGHSPDLHENVWVNRMPNHL